LPLTKQLITATVGQNIAEAFHTIHQVSVLHADVRPETILLRKDESVGIVDFERAEINGGA
jgi:DNA-binding helix-hairpin-helix protein with protein kinase domain